MRIHAFLVIPLPNQSPNGIATKQSPQGRCVYSDVTSASVLSSIIGHFDQLWRRTWKMISNCWPHNCRCGRDEGGGLVQAYTCNLNGAKDWAWDIIFYRTAIIVYIFLYIGNKFLQSPPRERQQCTSEAGGSNAALGEMNANPSRNQATTLHGHSLWSEQYQNAVFVTHIVIKARGEKNIGKYVICKRRVGTEKCNDNS